MSIKENLKKIKSFLRFSDGFKNTILKPKKELIIAIIIIFVGTASFGLGFLAGRDNNKIPVEISYEDGATTTETSLNNAQNSSQVVGSSKMFVASQNGTKYYLTTCSGVKNIKEENKIFFNTKEEAEKAGFLPASNCKF